MSVWWRNLLQSIRARKFSRKSSGFWFKFGVLGSTVVAYPIGSLIANGPLLNFTFSLRHPDDVKLPKRLQDVFDEQYKLWLKNESRIPADSKVLFTCSRKNEQMDSSAFGSLGVRSGARISLPFYVVLTDHEMASKYCKEVLQPWSLHGDVVCVIWDSKLGQEIIETFMLSDRALKFLFLRDLYAQDGYAAYSTHAISWATFTAFFSLFIYWIHKKPYFGGSLRWFIVLYLILISLGWYGSKQWYNLFRYMADLHADSMSSRTSFDHSQGGKEYYHKMLKRNRLLKNLLEKGKFKITPAGDIRGIVSPLMARYKYLKDVTKEDAELKEVFEGDD